MQLLQLTEKLQKYFGAQKNFSLTTGGNMYTLDGVDYSSGAQKKEDDLAFINDLNEAMSDTKRDRKLIT